jgi:hypothetical protein
MLSISMAAKFTFAWWIVEFADTHVPKLEDPGIKDQVVLAWKRIKARDLVKKRAEELVKLVSEGLANLKANAKTCRVHRRSDRAG